MISEVIYSVYSPAASFSQNAVEQSIFLEIDGGLDHRLVIYSLPESSGSFDGRKNAGMTKERVSV